MNMIFDLRTIGLLAMALLLSAAAFFLAVRKDRAAFVCVVWTIVIFVMEVVR